MLRLGDRATMGLSVLMLFGTGCAGPDQSGDGRGLTQTAGLRTALVASLNGDGTVTSHTETYTEEEYQAMVAARQNRASAAAGSPSSDGVETAHSALIQATGCSDTSALWAYDQADKKGAMLCLTGTGVYDLDTVGWKGLIQTVWPGVNGGQVSDYPICNRYWACTTWNSWGSWQNTPLCSSIVWGQYVVMPQTCY